MSDSSYMTYTANNKRQADAHRITKETDVYASVNLDGAGTSTMNTGLNFLDHLLASFAKHALLDLTVKATSLDDIRHHLVEDTAITVGNVIDQALGKRNGIVRFGHASVPLDESLADATVDLARRPYVHLSLSLKPADMNQSIEDVPKEDVEHFFQSLLNNIAACIHLDVKYGQNDHHKAEAAIKALAVALRQALQVDQRRAGQSPSTKGSL